MSFLKALLPAKSGTVGDDLNDARQGRHHDQSDASGIQMDVRAVSVCSWRGMEFGEIGFRQRLAPFGGHIERQAFAIVGDADGMAIMPGDSYAVRLSCEVLVQAVGRQFMNQVLHTSWSCIADVHAGSLTDHYSDVRGG